MHPHLESPRARRAIAGIPKTEGEAVMQTPIEQLEEIHRGLHLAMDALIKQKNQTEAENLLRQLDTMLATFIVRAKKQK